MECVEITSFEIEQYNGFVELASESFGRRMVLSEQGYREIIEADDNHLLAILEQGQAVAMLLLVTYTTFTGGKRGYIEDVAVSPSMQGAGLGRRVMNFAIEFARQHQVESISLTSSSKRTAAIALYKSLGFEIKETNCFLLKK